MTQTLKSVSVAIADLVAHPANVRANAPETYASDEIAHLTASIRALGLLQPLLVQKIDGKFGVLAGGRRHAALRALVAEEEAPDFTQKTRIACRLVPADCDVTTALSLAENITQAPMNPIDEFEAFARMMEVDGQTPESIAKTFGTTVAAVKGRLRYGMVHPDIRAAVRAREITLDVMKAFADHPSQTVQQEVFAALAAEHDPLQAWTVRQALKSRGVQLSDDLGAFVLEDYEARGGAIARDLLPEHSVLEDTALVEAILLEKLAAAADAARADRGFAWAEARAQVSYGDLSEYGRVYPGPVEPDAAGQARITAITERLDAISAELDREDLDEALVETLYAETDDLEAEAQDLSEAYAAEDLARAGVIASWQHGGVTLHLGLVRPEDKAEAATTQPTEAGPAGGGGGETEDAITYAASLADDLRTERAMALGAAMAQHPEATLDLTLFKLVSDGFGGMPATHGIEIAARPQQRAHAKMEEICSTSLEQVMEAQDAMDLGWRDEARSPADQFAIFRALEPAEKARQVAFATGSTTRPAFARDASRDSLMHAFEAEVMPDIRAHWTPNAALFNRLKKAQLLRLLADDLGLAQEAVALASSSKKEVVAFCDTLFAAPFATLTDAQRAAVDTWCPPGMQTDGARADQGAEAVRDATTPDLSRQQAA